MKTRQQIENYINSREWGKQFWMNSNITSEPWRLSWNKDMILLAFSWSDTREGADYWKTIDREYTKWYFT